MLEDSPVRTERCLVPIRGADPHRRPSPDVSLRDLPGWGADSPVVVAGSLLVFSSVEAVRRWRAVARFITASADDAQNVAARLGAHQVVWDAAGPIRRKVGVEGVEAARTATRTPLDIDALAAPLAPQAVATLRGELGARPQVRTAWVVEASVDRGKVIVVAFDLDDAAIDAAAVARSAGGSLVPLLPVDRYDGVQVILRSDPTVAEAVEGADRPIFEA